jgi:putative hemolysin
MKSILIFIIILVGLTACSAPQTQVEIDYPLTVIPQTGMPNPASVYCVQNVNKLEIQTTADSSQPRVCAFPNGSTCDEWAYFRGEYDVTTQNSPTLPPTIEATSNASGDYMQPSTQ